MAGWKADLPEQSEDAVPAEPDSSRARSVAGLAGHGCTRTRSTSAVDGCPPWHG